MMDSNWDLEGWERRIAPSVSNDRWIAHARTKLSRGYALIVHETRRNANFFKAGRGYEACRYTVALALIRAGSVVSAGRHALGTLYLLSPEGTLLPTPAPPAALPDDDAPMLAEDAALLALAEHAATAPAGDDPSDADEEADSAAPDSLDALFDGVAFPLAPLDDPPDGAPGRPRT